MFKDKKKSKFMAMEKGIMLSAMNRKARRKYITINKNNQKMEKFSKFIGNYLLFFPTLSVLI